MSQTSVTTKGREVIFTRIFNAPRELVFKAWTDPKQVVHWWGPDGFTNTIYEMDAKPGGVFRFTMHGPDGTDYPNKIIFIDVSAPERLSYKHSGEEDTEDVNFKVVITFEKEGDNKTKLTMRSIFESEEELERVNREYGATEGGKQHLGRLEEYLMRIMN